MQLSTKIISGFAAVLLLMAMVVGVYQYAITQTASGFKSVQVGTRINQYADKIESLSFQAEHNELAFLSSKDIKYADEQHDIIAKLISKADTIQKLAEQAGNSQTKNEAGSIIDHAQTYLTQFDLLVAAQKEAGLDEKSGLQGKFREAAHAVETNLKQYDVDDLYIALLQLKQMDKEFYRIKSESNMQQLSGAINKFRVLLARSTCAPEVKPTMEKAITAYREALEKFQAADQTLQKAIEYHNMGSATGAIEKAIGTIRAPGASDLMAKIRINEKDFLSRKDKKLIDELHQGVERMHKIFANSNVLPEHKEKIAKYMEEYRKSFDAMTLELDKINEAQATLAQTVQEMGKAVETIVLDAEDRTSQDAQTITAKSSWLGKTAISISLATMIIALLMGSIISRNIAKPIDQSVHELNTAASLVAAVSGHISASSLALADGASSQAASLEETSASMEEMSTVTKHNADNAGEADSLMKNVVAITQTADLSMNEMQRAMEEIASASSETSKIVKTINEIAFQTNLLALNAAVEAARAGEAGAGFAVVAEEVRNLAMRSAEAANNTAKLIEGTVDRVNHGKRVVASTNDAFKEVSSASAKVGSLVAEIATASKEQAKGLGQINQAIVQMDSITQQNSATAEESAASAQQLHAQADQLIIVVNGLRIMVEGGTAVVADTAAPSPPEKKRLAIGYAKA